MSTSTFAPKAIVFDLLTALLDSWSVWNEAVRADPSAKVDGQTWRKRYLEVTFGSGAYQPYESLVEQAAKDVGLSNAAPKALLGNWKDLKAWSGVPEVLAALRNKGYQLGVVTNCSAELGYDAVMLCEDQVQKVEGGKGFRFDAIVTAEESGFYKPNPKPYEDLLEKLKVAPEDALFVAGSSSDVPGASGVGMKVVWHNRIGLPQKGDVRPLREGKTLQEALEGVISID